MHTYTTSQIFESLELVTKINHAIKNGTIGDSEVSHCLIVLRSQIVSQVLESLATQKPQKTVVNHRIEYIGDVKHGYYARCLCGWVSDNALTDIDVSCAVNKHLMEPVR